MRSTARHFRHTRCRRQVPRAARLAPAPREAELPRLGPEGRRRGGGLRIRPARRLALEKAAPGEERRRRRPCPPALIWSATGDPLPISRERGGRPPDRHVAAVGQRDHHDEVVGLGAGRARRRAAARRGPRRCCRRVRSRSSASASALRPTAAAARLFARPCGPATITAARSAAVTPACLSALAIAASPAARRRARRSAPPTAARRLARHPPALEELRGDERGADRLGQHRLRRRPEPAGTPPPHRRRRARPRRPAARCGCRPAPPASAAPRPSRRAARPPPSGSSRACRRPSRSRPARARRGSRWRWSCRDRPGRRWRSRGGGRQPRGAAQRGPRRLDAHGGGVLVVGGDDPGAPPAAAPRASPMAFRSRRK